MRAVLSLEHRGAPTVCAAPERLLQVLVNLLVNAVQAFPDERRGGNRIRVTTAARGGEAVVEIADNGPGVPPQLRRRIFEPFFTTKAVGEGTGLGLSICASIVVAAGGRIEVDDAPEGGALFRVALPACEA